MKNRVVKSASDSPQRPSRSGSGLSLNDILGSDKITPEHVTALIGTISRVVDARIEAGLLEVAVAQKIRALSAELHNDSERAKRATESFHAMQEHMDPATRSALAAEIIRTQLGSIVVHPLFARRLNYSWLEAALDAWVVTEETNTRRASVQLMAKEMVAICESNRDRVVLAEAYYSEFRDTLMMADRQDVLRLMAETLLYIQYQGVRHKVTGDPIKLLGARR